jgi:hypothetical protein
MFPCRRSSALLSPRPAAFLNIAVDLYRFWRLCQVQRSFFCHYEVIIAQSVVVSIMLRSERTLVGWVESQSRLRRSIRQRTWLSRVLRPRRVSPTRTPRCQIVEARLASRRDTKPLAQSKHRDDSAERRYSATQEFFVSWCV